MASLTLRGRSKDGVILFPKDNEYMTPKSAWETIRKYIPTDKVIWEGFRGDGTSAEHLRSFGLEVVCEDEDFFENNRGEVIVTNPPYDCKAKIFEKLKEIDKPFILLVPVATITKKFYQDYFANKCGIIIPKKRIQFVKDGEQTTRSWFDVVYICYKIENIKPREMIYL